MYYKEPGCKCREVVRVDGWVSHRTVSFQTDHTAEQRKCNSPSATSGYVPTAISVTSDRLFNM